MSDALKTLNHLSAASHLEVFGLLREGSETIALLGPREPDFWANVSQSAEFLDGQCDPLDRWSKRVVGQIAKECGAKPVFPSDGPPYPPFISWALASGQSWVSPVGMLVHETAGLFISFRAALRFSEHLPLPAQTASPCVSCAKPCVSACPVNALSPDHYDVPSCMSHIRERDSAECRSKGCAARRACPVSQNYARSPLQSAFHMRAFLGE
jgi:epoxyqueuosine reductase